ncbi:MAG TPA: dihydroorotate dehydrogenase electron transfer subunit [Firmicutes bacterium]|nr:dihydroorotate dehydrogenase electron transfer subunit [Bacillota bacterium]
MQNYLVGKYPVIHKSSLAAGVYDYTLYCPEVAARAQAGQFVHIRVDGFTLRRPISICEIGQETGVIRLVFEVRGEGTKALSRINEGDLMDLIAPLGKGFSILPASSRVIAVGGGIGTPPMLETIKHYGANGAAVIGFRSAAQVILENDFVRTGAQTIVCTEDGSRGVKGFVTDPLRQLLSAGKTDLVCACGPAAMLKAVVALTEELGVRCEVSLEERMGCGVGACLVCACKTVKDGKEYYAHVCQDGPVFPAEEVIL